MRTYTYPYSAHYSPSMPVVELTLYIPGRAQSEQQRVGIIDTGSDATMIPLSILEIMGARAVKEGTIRGITGMSKLVSLYLIGMKIGPEDVHAVRVVGMPSGDEIILGRDVLNRVMLTLNGLANVTEIHE